MKTNQKNQVETALSFYISPRTMIVKVNTRCVLCGSGSDIQDAGEETDDIFGE